MVVMNFLVGLPIMVLCLIVQVAVVFWSVRYAVRKYADFAERDARLLKIRPLAVAMLAMMVGNLVQIATWGLLFLGLGEFKEVYEAVYHSAVNFTSLGYGDIVMSRKWKLLGPLEAVNGILMLGMTGAALMAILQQLIKAHQVYLERDRGGSAA